MKIPIISKDNIIYLKEGRLEIYLPQSYIEKGFCSINGTTVESLGVGCYKYYNKITDTKPSKVGTLNAPTLTIFYPRDIDPSVETTIYDNGPVGEYLILHFHAGDKVLNQVCIKKLDNVVNFTNLLLGGKLDNNIPYDLITRYWISNMSINDVNFNVPAVTLDVVVSELCRNPKNTQQPFRMVIGKDPKGVSPVAYKRSNTRDNCASNSVFSAIMFEDMNRMLDASICMTVHDKKQNISPIEKIIKM